MAKSKSTKSRALNAKATETVTAEQVTTLAAQAQRLNGIAAHLGCLGDLLQNLALGNEGDDLILAGTFYSLRYSVERSVADLEAVIAIAEGRAS